MTRQDTVAASVAAGQGSLAAASGAWVIAHDLSAAAWRHVHGLPTMPRQHGPESGKAVAALSDMPVAPTCSPGKRRRRSASVP